MFLIANNPAPTSLTLPEILFHFMNFENPHTISTHIKF